MIMILLMKQELLETRRTEHGFSKFGLLHRTILENAAFGLEIRKEGAAR
jgi:ABC-type proline/glycine betaine transport system ATPase subunit